MWSLKKQKNNTSIYKSWVWKSKAWQHCCDVSSRPAGGLHDQGEARVPDGQRSHQHVRPDHQEHRLRRPVHPRYRHHGPVEATACVRPLPAPPPLCTSGSAVNTPPAPPPLFDPDFRLVRLQRFATEPVGEQTCNVLFFFFFREDTWTHTASVRKLRPYPPPHTPPPPKNNIWWCVCVHLNFSLRILFSFGLLHFRSASVELKRCNSIFTATRGPHFRCHQN